MIPASIERFLATHSVSYTPLPHVRAITAQEEAAVTHTPGRAWAKTVVCVADNAPIQAVVPADRVVDPVRLRELVGARTLRIAEEVHQRCVAGCTLYPRGHTVHIFIVVVITVHHGLRFQIGNGLVLSVVIWDVHFAHATEVVIIVIMDR